MRPAERVVTVTQPTVRDELTLRHGSWDSAAFLLKERGQNPDAINDRHLAYQKTCAQIERRIPRGIVRVHVTREDLARFLFRESDLVVVIGRDGLVANTAKYLVDDQPMLAVNPDLEQNEGILVRFTPEDACERLTKIIAGDYVVDELVLAEAKTNDGQTLLAVNEFLVGRRDQVSSRYTISHGGVTENQSSSGVLVATGVGSTGWMSSYLAGASAIARAMGATIPRSATILREPCPFGWNEAKLLYGVREPYPSRATGTSLVIGWVNDRTPLKIVSNMPDGGVIVSDGVLEDALEFKAGVEVTLYPSARRAFLISP